MGYKFQFVTLAGFHALNHSMFTLSRGYAERGMAAYSELQQAEFASEQFGYTATKCALSGRFRKLKDFFRCCCFCVFASSPFLVNSLYDVSAQMWYLALLSCEVSGCEIQMRNCSNFDVQTCRHSQILAQASARGGDGILRSSLYNHQRPVIHNRTQGQHRGRAVSLKLAMMLAQTRCTPAIRSLMLMPYQAC